MATPKNSRARPVTQLCLALESHRRTDAGRVRDAKAFLGHYFAVGPNGATDRLFVHLPNEVRADLLSNWGIRGKKSALRDDDEKVRTTVVDALEAGDIDATVIEASVTPEILVDWIPLDDWWRFWRGNALPVAAVQKALDLARGLALYDDRWLIDNLAIPAQKLEKTDVICAGLSKDQLVSWMNAVHASGDASPAGLVRALGWETVLAKTAESALGNALDALARHIGLAVANADKLAVALAIATPSAATPTAAMPTAAAVVTVKPGDSSGAYSKVLVPEKAAAATPAARAPTAGALPSRVVTAAAQLPNVVIDVEPKPSKPAGSSPPNARALFGEPTREAIANLPPMRPPQTTLTGVGGPTPEDALAIVSVAMPTTPPSAGPPPNGEDPSWAPPRAEPGDMGWDIVHGVSMSISNLQPKYNFENDDEPTSEISLPSVPLKAAP